MPPYNRTYFIFVIFFRPPRERFNFSIRIDFVQPLPDYFRVMVPAHLSITAFNRGRAASEFGRFRYKYPDHCADVGPLSRPILAAKPMILRVSDQANNQASTTQLFHTGTISRYFSSMALRSTGCLFQLSQFSFLLLHIPRATQATITATTPPAVDT